MNIPNEIYIEIIKYLIPLDLYKYSLDLSQLLNRLTDLDYRLNRYCRILTENYKTIINMMQANKNLNELISKYCMNVIYFPYGLDIPTVKKYNTSHIISLTDNIFNDHPIITDEHLIKMNNNTPIKSIFIGGSLGITNRGISALTQLRCLAIKYIGDVNDDGIKNLTELTHISIDGMYVNLDIRSIGNKNITDKGIINLRKMKYLALYYDGGITDDGLIDKTDIRTLKLNHNRLVTYNGIKNMKKLEYIEMWRNRHINLDIVSNFPNLRYMCTYKCVWEK